MLSSAVWIEFILCEVYLVKLLSFMLGVKHKPHIRSMQEFNQTALSIYVMDGDPELRKSVRLYFAEDRLVLGSKNEYTVFPLETNSTYIMGCEVAQVIAAMPWNWDPVSAMRKFYLMQEHIHWYLSATVFTPRSPMFQKYKLVSDWVFESGMWNYWESHFEHGYGRLPQRECDTLDFDDLISIWWLLLGSGVFGIAVLLLECAVHTFVGRLNNSGETGNK